MSEIQFDFSHCLKACPEARLEDSAREWHQAQRGLRAIDAMGKLPFLHFDALEAEVEALRRRIQTAQIQNQRLVVLGLGAAVQTAQLYAQWTGQEGRLLALETLDPHQLQGIFSQLDPETTLFYAVSKSGNTAATMAQLMWVMQWLKKHERPLAAHLWIATDLKPNPLRQLAEREGLQTFPWPGVSGRFAALTPLGLVPAAFAGIDLKELIAGARRMSERCRSEDFWVNPAAQNAGLWHYFFRVSQLRQLVILNYVPRLHAAWAWLSQLVAESLASTFDLSANEVRSGITPLLLRGPQDQHTQLEPILAGSREHLVLLSQPALSSQDLKLPDLYPDREHLNYLAGKTLGELMRAECQATETTLCEAGIPNYSFQIKELGASQLGQFLAFWQWTVIHLGAMWNLQTFGQEASQKLKAHLFRILGRAGY